MRIGPIDLAMGRREELIVDYRLLYLGDKGYLNIQ